MVKPKNENQLAVFLLANWFFSGLYWISASWRINSPALFCLSFAGWRLNLRAIFFYKTFNKISSFSCFELFFSEQSIFFSNTFF